MKKNQRDRILEYVDRFGTITSSEAISELGCTRLSARISELKNMGYPFEKRMIQSRNRFGETVSYAEYYMKATDEK